MNSDLIAAELDLSIDFNNLIPELHALVSDDWEDDHCHITVRMDKELIRFEHKNHKVQDLITPGSFNMTLKELDSWAKQKKWSRLFSNFPRQVDQESIKGFYHSKTFSHNQYQWIEEYNTTHLRKFLSKIPHNCLGAVRIMKVSDDLFIHNDVDENTLNDISYKLTLLINLKMPDPFTMIDPNSQQIYQFKSPALLINQTCQHGFINTSGEQWFGFSVNAEFDFNWLLARASRIVRISN